MAPCPPLNETLIDIKEYWLLTNNITSIIRMIRVPPTATMIHCHRVRMISVGGLIDGGFVVGLSMLSTNRSTMTLWKKDPIQSLQ